MLWGSDDGDAAAAAELEQAFVAELAECAQDGVGVDAENGGQVFGGGRRSPGLASPSAIARRISPATCSWSSRGSPRSTLTPSMMLVIVASSREVVIAVTAPPRPPDSSPPGSTVPIDRGELEALIEALIEEARQRARRRRRRYGAVVVLVALVAGGVYFGFDRGGGATGSQAAQAGSSGPAASAFGVAAGGWAPSHGPYGGDVYVVAAAPSAKDIVYVGTRSGVFVSRNRGRSWQSAGLAVQGSRVSASDPPISSLAVDPRDPATVYAARTWQLAKSTNGGRSWRALGVAARLVFVSPANPAAVYAITGDEFATTNRLFRSTNGGRSWQPADSGLASTYFWTIAFDPTAFMTVYAATGRGVLKSTDGGVHWQRVSRQEVSAVAVDPRDPQIVYAGTDGGLIKSLDGGHSWRVVNTGDGQPRA